MNSHEFSTKQANRPLENVEKWLKRESFSGLIPHNIITIKAFGGCDNSFIPTVSIPDTTLLPYPGLDLQLQHLET